MHFLTLFLSHFARCLQYCCNSTGYLLHLPILGRSWGCLFNAWLQNLPHVFGWVFELVAVTDIAYHFRTNQTVQWPLVPYMEDLQLLCFSIHSSIFTFNLSPICTITCILCWTNQTPPYSVDKNVKFVLRVGREERSWGRGNLPIRRKLIQNGKGSPSVNHEVLMKFSH